VICVAGAGLYRNGFGGVILIDGVRANYNKLLAGQIVSYFGSWFHLIALISLIYRLTGSSMALGLAFVVKFLPKIVFSLFSGYFVDRMDRRRVMIASDLASFVFTLVIAALVPDIGLTVLYALLFLLNGASSLFDPARMSFIPTLFSDKKQFARATAEFTIARYATMLLATALGGFLVEMLGVRLIFTFDAVSYLVSALLVLAIRVEALPVGAATARREEKAAGPVTLRGLASDVAATLAEGFDVARRSSVMRSILSTWSFRQFAYGHANIVFGLLVLEKLGAGEHWLGLAYASGGVGCVIAGFGVRRFLRARRVELSTFYPWNLGLNLVNAALLLAMFLSPNIVTFLLVVLIHDLESSVITFADERYVGRMSSLYVTVGKLVFFAGNLSFTFLLGRILGFTALGAVLSGLVVLGAIAPRWRTLLPARPRAGRVRPPASGRRPGCPRPSGR